MDRPRAVAYNRHSLGGFSIWWVASRRSHDGGRRRRELGVTAFRRWCVLCVRVSVRSVLQGYFLAMWMTFLRRNERERHSSRIRLHASVRLAKLGSLAVLRRFLPITRVLKLMM